MYVLLLLLFTRHSIVPVPLWVNGTLNLTIEFAGALPLVENWKLSRLKLREFNSPPPPPAWFTSAVKTRSLAEPADGSEMPTSTSHS
jgi:hypothetical protein